MAHGLLRLRFACTRCGNCCRRFRVPLTGADLGRLVTATGKEPDELVQWLSPAEVDMTGEPETFVELRQGRCIMMLSWKGQGCSLLNGDQCGVHAQRPSSCRMYPYDVRLGRRGGIARLKLLSLTDCEYVWERPDNRRVVAQHAARHQAELAAYVGHVTAFNREQRHRRRLGKRLLGREVFYRRFLGCVPAEAPR